MTLIIKNLNLGQLLKIKLTNYNIWQEVILQKKKDKK